VQWLLTPHLFFWLPWLSGLQIFLWLPLLLWFCARLLSCYLRHTFCKGCCSNTTTTTTTVIRIRRAQQITKITYELCHVCPSVHVEQLGSQWMDFHEILFGNFLKICSISSAYIFKCFFYLFVEEGSVAYFFLNSEISAHVLGGRGRIYVLIMGTCFLLTQILWHESTNLYTDFRISKWSFWIARIICLWNQLNFLFQMSCLFNLVCSLNQRCL
jgi:hypothetical protein